MGDVVAVFAVGELLQHCRRMWPVVALQAGRDHLVPRVAGGTGHLLVAGLARLQRPVGSGVAGGAIFCRQVVRIRDGQRLMGAMAGDTVGLNHLPGMGLVALNTLRDIAVAGRMAIDA